MKIYVGFWEINIGELIQNPCPRSQILGRRDNNKHKLLNL